MNIPRNIGIAVLITLSVQCANASDGNLGEARARVRDAVWEYHLAVIKAVVEAQNRRDVTLDLTQFGRSVDLIESLTNIVSNTGTRLGRLPTPELPLTIQLWERWYTDNRDKVDIDISGCSLILK